MRGLLRGVRDGRFGPGRFIGCEVEHDDQGSRGRQCSTADAGDPAATEAPVFGLRRQSGHALILDSVAVAISSVDVGWPGRER